MTETEAQPAAAAVAAARTDTAAAGATGTAQPAAESPKGFRLFEGKLHRVQRGHGKTFVEGPPPLPRVPVRRPARVAIMLALAHKIQEAIDRGAARDRAEVARRLGLTRARLTQLMDITLLAPDIQERVLQLEAVDGRQPLAERALREIVGHESWAEQRVAWRALRSEREAGAAGAGSGAMCSCKPECSMLHDAHAPGREAPSSETRP